MLEFLEMSIEIGTIFTYQKKEKEIGSILCMHTGSPIWHCIVMMLAYFAARISSSITLSSAHSNVFGPLQRVCLTI